ncbi:HEAT repeat domain-containing protein [Cytophagaceae bacterium YF14B1]|uniref:HEAT repeat domain-containing protein n=1 Tax=Xanthocytophaga flava TaxID=3048013 RepID=A0AAE3QL73_9BACT|nr:zf-HC2 domain-containing protein [Xanthocytophaga flavus]MDJ1479525.1 HEAT repeat domain-containing protein [Xanthocytophaga flavus]
MTNCKDIEEKLADWLENQLSPQEQAQVESHLKQCPACQQEWQAMQQVWMQMGQLPVPKPSPAMKIRFEAMLETYATTVEEQQTYSPRHLLQLVKQLWQSVWMPRLVYSLLLISIGLGAGYWLHKPSDSQISQYQHQIDTLSIQMQEMRQMMLLSLLENPSASERLRAVSLTQEFKRVDPKVIKALLTTLNNDPNVNVRLVTLEALAELADDPSVREGLVQSLAHQDSPLVQVALADIMVKLQEKRSIELLRELLKQKHVDGTVKSKIQQTIKELS